ncbi:hypothetical protein N9140_01165, partial [bacterium]|nr:hypothetical protein [bacterium]
ERDKEIDQLTKSVQKQEKEIETCEWMSDEANAKCRENEKKFKKKESKLEREVKDLSRRNAETESQLDHLEAAEEEAREKEHLLVQQLDNIGEVCPEREARIELEKQLSCSKQDFESIQENAIGSLSDLLNDLDTMRIPSLQRDAKDCRREDGGVSGDIIARFDDFTDKEEEFVRILSDPVRLTACQASLKQIQSKLERALQDGQKLGNLEADLRSHSNTLLTLINGDEGTDTTSSSTASERVSMERVFVEAVISQLESFNANQGKVLLNSLPKILQYITQWEIFLQANSSSHSSSNAPSSGGEFSSVVEIISMMDGLVKEIESVVAKAKNIIRQEHSRYQGSMNDAGIVSHCSISHAISIRSSKANDSNNNKQNQTDT